MTRQQKRYITLLCFSIGAIGLIWAGHQGYRVDNCPIQYAGYFFGLVVAAYFFGFNIFYGGPYDPRHDSPSGSWPGAGSLPGIDQSLSSTQPVLLKPRPGMLLMTPLFILTGLALFFWGIGRVDFTKLLDIYSILENLEAMVFVILGLVALVYYWPGFWEQELEIDRQSLTFRRKNQYDLTVLYRDIQNYRKTLFTIEIMGFGGRRLLKFFNNFRDSALLAVWLKDIILNNSSLAPLDRLVFAAERSLKKYLIFLFSVFFGSVGLTYWLMDNWLGAAMVAGVVGPLLGFMFWNTQGNVQKVEVQGGEIAFSTMLKRRTYPLTDIQSMYPGKIFVHNAAVPVLVFVLKNGKRINVQKLDEDLLLMYGRIEKLFERAIPPSGSDQA